MQCSRTFWLAFAGSLALAVPQGHTRVLFSTPAWGSRGSGLLPTPEGKELNY